MPAQHGFVECLAELSKSGVPFVCVTMVDAIGSTPQDTGSKMLVTAEGLVTGTVGGGRVEAKAVQFAVEMLSHPSHDSPQPPASSPQLLEWNLKRDVGMTCGGTVKLFFEPYNHHEWQIVVFGAGHVANALVQLLGQLDCQVTCIDPRPEWLAKIPDRPRLKKVHCAEPRTIVAELPVDAFVICMTMGHATDRPILEEIFRLGREFPFLGVIGSKAKRAVLLKELVTAGIPRDRAESFHCPIGLDLGTNHPAEIAISIVAHLIQVRDRGRSTSKS